MLHTRGQHLAQRVGRGGVGALHRPSHVAVSHSAPLRGAPVSLRTLSAGRDAGAKRLGACEGVPGVVAGEDTANVNTGQTD